MLKHESQDNPDNTEHIIGIIWEVPKSEEQSTIGVNLLQYLAGRVAMYSLYLLDEHPEIKFADSLVSFNLYTNVELSHEAEDYATENKISITHHI